MNLDFFNDVKNNLKSNDLINNFLQELSSFINDNKNLNILNELKSKNKISLISENKIIKKQNEILKQYPNMKNYNLIKKQIKQIANEIINNQNQKLKNFRKEGHLYMVEEDIDNRIYLKDLTASSKKVLEEVEFSKELLNKATEGAIFKYTNGKYEFVSYDGFEK